MSERSTSELRPALLNDIDVFLSSLFDQLVVEAN